MTLTVVVGSSGSGKTTFLNDGTCVYALFDHFSCALLGRPSTTEVQKHRPPPSHGRPEGQTRRAVQFVCNSASDPLFLRSCLSFQQPQTYIQSRNDTSAHIFVNTMAYDRTFPLPKFPGLTPPRCVSSCVFLATCCLFCAISCRLEHCTNAFLIVSLVLLCWRGGGDGLFLSATATTAYWDIYVREKTADTILAGGTMAGEFTGM
jgi:hypothetical protein